MTDSWKIEKDRKTFYKNKAKEDRELERLIVKLNKEIEANGGKIPFYCASVVSRISELYERRDIRKIVERNMEALSEKMQRYDTESLKDFFKKRTRTYAVDRSEFGSEKITALRFSKEEAEEQK